MSGVSYIIVVDKNATKEQLLFLARRILRKAQRSGPLANQGVNNNNTGNFAKGWRIAPQYSKRRIRLFNNVKYAGYVEGGSKTNPYYKNWVRYLTRDLVRRWKIGMRVGRRTYR